MGNTEDKKEDIIKRIPRNPNVPIQDEEVEKLLKKAAAQVSEKEKKAGMATSGKSGTVVKSSETKTEKSTEKKGTDTKTDKKDNTKRENINIQKNASEKKTETVVQDKKIDSRVAPSKSVGKKDVSEVTTDKKVVATQKESVKPVAKQKQVDFKVEEDVYVTKNAPSTPVVRDEKRKISDMIGSVLEGIWIGVKLVVVVAIVTAFVGFFMARDLMVRGRSGELISKQGMNISATVLSNASSQKAEGKVWSQTVKMDKLTLEADDGKILVAKKVVVDKDCDDWVVVLHGQNGSVEDIYDIGFRYATQGYNVLMPDLRAHGESEGSLYGMGWLDRLDVINWIDIILDENASANVIIHGVDLGADTALMLSGEPLKDSIKAIVAEGAYPTAWDVAKKEYKARHESWPVFPILHMLNPVMKVWAGYSLNEADAVEQVKKTKVPVLLIYGQNDTYVTEGMAEELDKAIASEHEMLKIASGTHEDCRFAEPDTYYNKVFEFVERWVH